jgi:hypothetical protein
LCATCHVFFAKQAVITMLVCGLIFPILIILFVEWSTILHKILLVLAIYCLASVVFFTFFLFLYLWIKKSKGYKFHKQCFLKKTGDNERN